MNFNNWNVTIAGSSNVITSGIITTIPDRTIYIYPGMNIQAAINSLSGGGVITLLPGNHNITNTILVNQNNITINGYGDSSRIIASGIAANDPNSAIQLGAVDGSAPVSDILLSDFRLDVNGPNIHGIRAAGGTDIRIENLTVIKTAGTAGTGATATVGIILLDGTASALIRPVVSGCRVLGNGGANYFTDGIHLTGGVNYGFAGIWMNNGGGIQNALVESNFIDYVRETVFVFIGASDSSLYNNRLTRMGVGGGGAIGLYMGNSTRINVTANVIAQSSGATTTGLVIDTISTASLKEVTDSIFSNNTIDGTVGGGTGFQRAIDAGNITNVGIHRNLFTNNVVNGASNVVTVGISLSGNADDNIFSNNIINGLTNTWDTGISINDSVAERNKIVENNYINTTLQINNNGTYTQFEVNQIRSTSNPTVNDDNLDGYTIGTIWINSSTDNAFIATDVATAAAVWEQIDGAGGSADLDGVYTTDIDKILNINNVSGLQFVSTTAGNIRFDLQSTGDFAITDNATDLFSVLDVGFVGIGTDTPLAALDINSAGTAGAPSLIFESDSDTGIFHPLANNVAISAAGVERIRITANGLRFASDVADPGSPQEGDIWFRSDTDNLKIFTDGRIQEIQTVAIAQVYQSGTIAIGAVDIGIPWNGTSATFRFVDSTYTHSTVTNPSRVTINDSGLYKINYSVGWDNSANAIREVTCSFYVNGAAVAPTVGSSYGISNNNANDNASNNAEFYYQFTAGNYYEVFCLSTGTAGTVNTVANRSWTTIELIRRN